MNKRKIPYGRQWIGADDIRSVRDVLCSDLITQGPVVAKFENALAKYCGVKYTVAVSSGTAALHIACLAAGLSGRDEAITSPITFVATSNAVIYAGAIPVFADIDPRTNNIDPVRIVKKMTSRTAAILPVHFGGLPCDMENIHKISKINKLIVIEDACHALGAQYKYKGKWVKVGSCKHSDMTVFSFHPVKAITTGEGGAITTNNRLLYEKLLALRSHGIYKDKDMAARIGPWFYEMRDLGFNYRITDFQCALGMSQLNKIDSFLNKRKKIAEIYDRELEQFSDKIGLPANVENIKDAHHLYVIKVNFDKIKKSRKLIMESLRRMGISTQVHYVPVYRHPYYQNRYKISNEDFPISEDYYRKALSLPIYPNIGRANIAHVINALKKVLS